MKSLFQLFCVILLTSFAFVSCSSDDDGDYDFPSKITNTLEYEGKSYNIKSVTQEYWGDYNDKGSNNIDLIFDVDGVYSGFEMFVSKNDTKLVSGTYTAANNYKAGTFWNNVNDYDDDDYLSGAIKIEVSGSTYTIYLDCKVDGKSLRGSYKGSLIYEDFSAED